MLLVLFECLSIVILLNRGLLRAALDDQGEQITYIVSFPPLGLPTMPSACSLVRFLMRCNQRELASTERMVADTMLLEYKMQIVAANAN